MIGVKGKFSVLIPTYNHEKFIVRCIESVLSQTYRNFDVWVIDDCSTDNTVGLIREFTDPRINLVCNTFNRGINWNLNKLFEMSDGEYVCGIGSDDAMHPELLETVADVFSKNPNVGVCYCDLNILDENGRQCSSSRIRENTRLTKEEVLRETFLRYPVVWTPGRSARRSIYNSIVPLSSAFMNMQDVEETTRLLFSADFHVIKKPLVDYRVFEGNVSAAGEVVRMRTECEDSFLMEEFSKQESDDLLNRIFAADLKVLGLSFGKFNRRYVFARLAMTSSLEHKRRWGYAQMLALVAEKGIDGFYTEFGLSYKELLSLSKSLYDPRKDYKRKYKKAAARVKWLVAAIPIVIFVTVLALAILWNGV